MSLLAPWALWFSPILAAVVALYLLKIKRRRQTVPALEFWRELAGQTQVRSLFQRLKRWLSLALWLLIVLCLLFALGNPVVTLGSIKPQSIAIIVDNSASMQTMEKVGDAPERTRLVDALAAVDELSARRPVLDEWTLIEASIRPKVLQPWTTHRKSIQDAVTTITPNDGAADLSAAVELATHLLAGKSRPCIVIVSDGAAGKVDKLLAENDNIVYWPVGRTQDNLGITRLGVRPQQDQTAHHAYVRVVNASSEPVDSQIVFEIDNSIATIEPVTIPAHEAAERSVVLNSPQGGVLRAYIDRPDALAADNDSFAVLPPMRKVAVSLVTSPETSFFFERALTAMEGLVDEDASRVLTPDEYKASGSQDPRSDIVIFNNCKPAALLGKGSFIFINQYPSEFVSHAAGTIERPLLTISQRDHPITRYLELGAVTVARAARLELRERATILAQSAEGNPLIFLLQEPDRTSLCIAFDVMDTDMPFRIAFPLLLRNAIAFLSSQGAAWVLDQYRIGEVIESLRPLPDGVAGITAAHLTQAKVAEQTVPVIDGRFLFDETRRAGPIRFEIGEATAYTAVNLADESETRIAPTKASQSPEERLALSQRFMGLAPWLALALAATTLIGLEWLTYHFRWTE
jgi:VWA domain-containing protein/aerotolerance regulator-like protein